MLRGCRGARLGVEHQGAVVCQYETANVARDEDADLDVPDRGRTDDAVVDRAAGGAEQVPAPAERVREQVRDRLSIVDEQ